VGDRAERRASPLTLRRLALGGLLAAALAGASAAPAMASGTKVVVRDSEFGPMLWGPQSRALYIFQRDGRKVSRCYGACARAWPPLLTKGRPVAGPGVRRSLLGTTRRRNGKLQVTYDGKPLYRYAHEGPGQVLCHDVNLNGGFWWVIGPDGRRRPSP
jgi:predicted lipoprotein with Yx(FWY)xxD motif